MSVTPNATSTKPIDILLVEDSPGDARLMREALRDAKIRNQVFHVKDGVEAIQFLNRMGDFFAVPEPDVILLDLNLPRKDGREVLAEVKAHPNFRRIPVVILTTSDAEEDILKSYSLAANCYITKPVDLDQFMRVIQSIEEFWLSVVTLPPPNEFADPAL